MLKQIFALLLALSLTAAAHAASSYDVNYTARFKAGAPSAQVTVALGANAMQVKTLTFRFKSAKRYSDWRGDGQVEVSANSVRWTPKGNNPALSYNYFIDHIREDGAYDARMTADWALFRGDDLVPMVQARTVKGARSKATLKFELPKGWSVETPWLEDTANLFLINNPRRSFDRPVGWMLVGVIGSRRDMIDGTQVAVSGPVGAGPRRQDILAFMNWTLPEYRSAFGSLPKKFLIVGADDRMWRGGLSGPGSFYFHPDRPLISENGTSSLLHELVHTVQRIKAAPRHDWIVEGMAEFYAVELLHRAGGSSEDRYQRTHDWLRDWGKGVKSIYTSRSSGEITARAVGILRAVDEELRRETENEKSLDDVARAMMRTEQDVSLKQLRQLTRGIAGRDLKALSNIALPGEESPEDAP